MVTRWTGDVPEGMALGADERQMAARSLLVVDDAEQPDMDLAWDEEIDRRLGEILSGGVQLLDGERSHDRLRAELAARYS